MEETRFFVDLGLLFLAALGGGALAQLLRQPLIIGYMVSGILIGPFTPGPTIQHLPTFQLFADIGVVLLMFSIGVEFSIGELLRVRRAALYGAPVAIPAMVLLTVLLTRGLLGWPVQQGLVAGATVSVASTMVLLKTLVERGELNAAHGRVVVGIAVAEDLAVVALTVLIPALGPAAGSRVLLVARALLHAAAILVPLLWLARRVVPHLLARIARTRNMELLLLVSMALAIGTAALTASLGLSLALGAFLAGLLISESEFAHETLARVLPIRDIFVAVFFVSMGTLIRPAAVVAQISTVLVLVALVVAGRFAVWTAIVRAAGYPARTAILTGMGLTQIGEFSYVLAGVGRQHGLITDAVYQAILATSLVTILINAQTFRHTPGWLRVLLGRRERPPEPAPPLEREGHVIVCGFGRVGQEVATALEAFRVPYTVVDLDPEATRLALARGAVAVFGDAGNDAILRRAGAEHARLAVVAVPALESADRCVRALRRVRGDLPTLVRVHQEGHRALLIEAGATEVIQPEVEAALTIVRHSLDHLGVDHHEGRRYLQQARAHWPEAFRSDEPPVPDALDVRQFVIENSHLAGHSLHRVRLRERTGATVVSILHPDGRETTNPLPDHVLHVGDRLFAIGSAEQLASLRDLCRADSPQRTKG
ncbi:MAG: cation:proton antiporter [Armatimonadetes bacterium]|nr:cation:proton antiporter [Armatimonadota bacterium]